MKPFKREPLRSPALRHTSESALRGGSCKRMERNNDNEHYVERGGTQAGFAGGRENDYRAAIPRSKSNSRSRPRSSECRRLTIRHVSSLRSETAGRLSVTTETVEHRRGPWSGYNQYGTDLSTSPRFGCNRARCWPERRHRCCAFKAGRARRGEAGREPEQDPFHGPLARRAD